MIETHYTAYIKVERVDKEVTTSKAYDKHERKVVDATTSGRREVSSVAQMSISAGDLESLANRVGKHLDLLEDGEMTATVEGDTL